SRAIAARPAVARNRFRSERKRTPCTLYVRRALMESRAISPTNRVLHEETAAPERPSRRAGPLQSPTRGPRREFGPRASSVTRFDAVRRAPHSSAPRSGIAACAGRALTCAGTLARSYQRYFQQLEVLTAGITAFERPPCSTAAA